MTILSSREHTCIQNTKRNKTELCNELLDPEKVSLTLSTILAERQAFNNNMTAECFVICAYYLHGVIIHEKLSQKVLNHFVEGSYYL